MSNAAMPTNTIYLPTPFSRRQSRNRSRALIGHGSAQPSYALFLEFAHRAIKRPTVRESKPPFMLPIIAEMNVLGARGSPVIS